MIIIHTGIPETGSSTVQRWLRDHKDALARHGFTLVVGRPDPGPDLLRFEPHREGTADSGGVIYPLRDPATKARAAAELAEQLDALADIHGPVVLSGESLSQPFWQHDLDVLGPLGDLAERKTVRVAYYVRPQHTAMEAAWRQRGFRSGMPPSQYILDRARQLHYLDTLTRSGVDVPSIELDMRPFHRDLLVGHDVVKDFVHHFLDIPASEISDPKDIYHVGLPLVVANLLATVPEGALWSSPHEDRVLNRLRDLLAELDSTDDSTDAGRLLLQGWAAAQFGDENRRLLELMGWDMDDPWIPETARRGPIESLDEHWSPSASPAELAVLHRLLEEASRGAADRR